MAFNMIGPCRPLAGCAVFTVEFKNASGLLHSNDLRVAGVKAGQVTTVSNRENLAVVTIQVQPQFLPVYKDAHAIVRPKNLLGETYVEIDRGSPSAGEMAPGDTIPLKNTITPVQVDEVLNALDPDTRTKLQIVINTLGEASASRGKDLNLSGADLKRISADLAVTSASLDQERDNIDAILVQLDLIQQTVADYHDQLTQTLNDWNDVSIMTQRHEVALGDALGHLNHVLGDLDYAITPNAPALAGAVNNLPPTIDHAQDFLGISTEIQDLFLKQNPAGGNPTIRDGINLFPRLAQTMLGVNTCDYHIYASGYYNVPGVTEPDTCTSPIDANGNPVDPTLSSEQFTGKPAPGVKPDDRHLWRVMGMIEPGSSQCALVNPTTADNKTCYPGDAGLAPWGGAGSNGWSATSLGTGNPSPGLAGTSNSDAPGFWQSFWADLTGGGRA
jgi:virulence factor Mce-like protein